MKKIRKFENFKIEESSEVKTIIFGAIIAILSIALKAGLTVLIKFILNWLSDIAIRSISETISSIKDIVMPDIMVKISRKLDKNERFNQQVLEYLSNHDIGKMTPRQFAKGLTNLDEFKKVFDEMMITNKINSEIEKELLLKKIIESIEDKFLYQSEDILKSIQKRFPHLTNK